MLKKSSLSLNAKNILLSTTIFYNISTKSKLIKYFRYHLYAVSFASQCSRLTSKVTHTKKHAYCAVVAKDVCFC